MKNTNDIVIDKISDIFSEFVPKICETLSLVDDEEKYGFIGATTEMFLGSLINYSFYGDFMVPDTELTEKWKAKVAIELAHGCIDKGGADA